MKFELDRRFLKTVRARYERFELRAGILQDRPHFSAAPAKKGLGTLQGGPVRKKSGSIKTTVGRVGEAIRKEHGVSYLKRPFDRPNSKDMREFRKAFGDLLTGVTRSYGKVEATFRAVIRNPILQGKYGRNTRHWARAKTFNRFLIDTGQFFRAITAKIRSTKGR